jgi:PAS domain S-box-containing protein
MSEFMHQVARIWYRLYWAGMLCFSVILGLASLVVAFVPGLEGISSTFGLGTNSLILACIHVFYSLTVFWWLARSSWPFATLVAAMIFSVLLLNGITQTDPGMGTYVYVGGWIALTAFNGIFGPPLLISTALLAAISVLIGSEFEVANMSIPAFIMVGGSTTVSVLAFVFWRRKFVDIELQAVNQLSGMLRNNQQQSEILIQSIADGIIVTNMEGKITIMNPMAAVMTQWPIDEATNINVQSVVKVNKESGAELPADQNPFVLVLQQRQRINQTLELAGRNGDKRMISLVISPIVPAGETAPIGAVAVMRDVSQERAAEKQRAEFISTASHEMRTPVAAIEGYLALALNDKVSSIDSKARSFLEKAHASTQHLGKLFQDLLTSSKAEDGRLTSHPVVVEMGSFMQQVTDDLKFAAEKKGLFSEFVIGEAKETVDATTKDASTQHLLKPLYYVFADPDRLREVITNLFDNACKYTDRGKVSLGLTGDPDVVQVYVRDTGAGIPATDIPHMFQKFYRVDNSATRTIGGTGLGLFICRKIIELYKGRIWVESTVGVGSTFFINLPRLTSQKASELQAAEAQGLTVPAPTATATTPAAAPAATASATPAPAPPPATPVAHS